MQRNRKKRIASTIGACALVSALGVSGFSYAYLTDSEKAVNVFTVGDVKIELLEPNYPGNDNEDKVDDLVPNEEVDKDPKVVNTGVNDTVVFMVVDSPMEAITLVSDNGTPVNTQTLTETQRYTDENGNDAVRTVATEVPQRKVDEIFWFKDKNDSASAHVNNFDPNWTMLPAKSVYLIIDKDGNETPVAMSDLTQAGISDDTLQDLDDTTENMPLYTGAQNIFRTDVDGTNKITARQDALQRIYAKLPASSTLVHRYVFAYKTDTQGSTMNDDDDVRASAKLGDAASERETTSLFDKIQLKNFIENEIDHTQQSIGIRAYAIQADEILENSADLGDDLTSETNLNHIYEIFVKQNSESSGGSLKVLNMRDADSTRLTYEGEITRQENGTRQDPSVSHVNRWNGEGDVMGEGLNVNPNGSGSSGGSSGGQAQPTSGPITFSMNGMDMSRMNVEAGTTWGELLTSLDGSYETSEEGYIKGTGGWYFVDANGNYMKPGDVILNGGTYYTIDHVMAANEIKFLVNGGYNTATQGTTWGEHLASMEDGSGGYGISPEGYIKDAFDNYYVDANGNYMKPSDVILNGGTYYTVDHVLAADEIMFFVGSEMHTAEAGTTFKDRFGPIGGGYATTSEGYFLMPGNTYLVDTTGTAMEPDDTITNGMHYSPVTYTGEIKETISFRLVGKNNKPIKLAVIPASYDWNLWLTAEPDMTWGEWCDSKYNTYGLTVLSNGKIGESNGERTVKRLKENGYTMFSDDIIEPQGFYWLSEAVTEGQK